MQVSLDKSALTPKVKASQQAFFTPWRLGLIAVFVLSVLFYLPSLMGVAVWDDLQLLGPGGNATDSLNGVLTHPFLDHYFRPLTSLSYIIDHAFSQSVPFFYHQTNILLHAATAVLVSYLALIVTGSKRAGILAGLFFAFQPMQLAAVAWMGGRTDVLSTFFVTASLLTLVLYYKTQKGYWIGWSVFAYLLAVFTKEQCALLILAAPISVYCFGDRQFKTAARISIPFALGGVLFAILFLLNYPGFTLHEPWRLGTATAAFCRTVGHYSLAFLAPTPSSMVNFTFQNYASPIWIGIGALFTLGWIGMTVWLWKVQRPLAWLLIVAFLLLFPVSNIPNLPSFWVAPYRVTLLGPSIACLLGTGLALAWEKRKIFGGLALAANLAVGGVVAWWGMHLWLSPATLFSAITKSDPYFITGRMLYIQALLKDDKAEEALSQSDSALRWIFDNSNWAADLPKYSAAVLNPTIKERLQTDSLYSKPEPIGEFCLGRASAHHMLGRDDLALEDLRNGLRYAPDNARIEMALGIALLDLAPREAHDHMERAAVLSPDDVSYWISLGVEAIKAKRYVAADSLLTVVINHGTWNGAPYVYDAEIKMKLGDLAGAQKLLDLAQDKLFLNKGALVEAENRLKAIKLQKAQLNRPH